MFGVLRFGGGKKKRSKARSRKKRALTLTSLCDPPPAVASTMRHGLLPSTRKEGGGRQWSAVSVGRTGT